ncbi:enoyl-CoA hydratase-related protein [Pseudonocardia sp. RS010]|uniref:enoyl-CoA hydratase-related protein n=1 Tax=Pseudonocardia sp. RS010 TaxID=3385979 RepID=UPI0039A3368D
MTPPKPAYETLLLDRVGTDGRVARITLNRPDKLNAISPTLAFELHGALRALEADHAVRAVILRGAGRAFCTGHDISEPQPESALSPGARFRTVDDEGRPLNVNVALMLRQVADVQMYLFRMGKVTIVQAHGYCIAGGLEFAMMADLVTASTDCRFGHPGHRGLGVARNGMLLPLVIGMRKAKELWYTGDEFDGEEAARLGLVNHVWPEAELEERTIALADRVANLSSDYLALLKAGVNKFYENMGLYSDIESLTAYDALMAGTESAYEWRDRVVRDGVRAALAWRDGPYGDYGAAPKQPPAQA